MTKVLYYKSKQKCINKYCITKVNKDVWPKYCIPKVNKRKYCITKVNKDVMTKVLYYKSKQSIVLQK